jgi:hypothetical protein
LGNFSETKETLKFESIFGSRPDFPSLRPQVKRERSQVALFLLCVVSPAISGHHNSFSFIIQHVFFAKVIHVIYISYRDDSQAIVWSSPRLVAQGIKQALKEVLQDGLHISQLYWHSIEKKKHSNLHMIII